MVKRKRVNKNKNLRNLILIIVVIIAVVFILYMVFYSSKIREGEKGLGTLPFYTQEPEPLPLPTSCYKYYIKESCENDDGCKWVENGGCNAQPNNCGEGDASAEECAGISGCYWDLSINTCRPNCHNHDNQADCEAETNPSCYWSDYSYCVGK